MFPVLLIKCLVTGYWCLRFTANVDCRRGQYSLALRYKCWRWYRKSLSVLVISPLKSTYIFERPAAGDGTTGLLPIALICCCFLPRRIQSIVYLPLSHSLYPPLLPPLFFTFLPLSCVCLQCILQFYQCKTTQPIWNHTKTKTNKTKVIVLFLSILNWKMCALSFIIFQTIAQTQTIRDTAPEGVRVNYTAYCP